MRVPFPFFITDYITVKDKALNQAYRDKYPTCHRQYSLGVPFTERFFDLTLTSDRNRPAGFVGMITTNSFMKREFGKKLIEDYLPRKELTYVVDTSGAYIPGHGTPTVILFARNQKPQSEFVRSVQGIRGEPSTPETAAHGKVWQSIVGMLEKPGSENEFISVVSQSRATYSLHPWSVGGGGVNEVKAELDSKKANTLGQLISDIGRTTHTGEDAIFYMPKDALLTRGLISNAVPLIVGEQIRDWEISAGDWALMPYDTDTGETLKILPDVLGQHFWPFRRLLRNRKDFGQFIEQRGLFWYEHSMFFPKRYRTPLSIPLPFIASHNHFVLDRGGKVFNRSAPVIKLSADATESDHLLLLGLLNSSTVCFWMKQVSQQKQLTGGDGVRVEFVSKVPYEFASTQLKKLPIPKSFNSPVVRKKVLQLTARADSIVREMSELSAADIIRLALNDGVAIQESWSRALNRRLTLRSHLILIQEELDWTIYHAYDLCPSELMADISGWFDVLIEAGQRPFEIASGLNQDGFCVPTDVPAEWPSDMQEKWRQRVDAIRSVRELRIIEDPHYKRRWIGRQGLFNQAARSNELSDACRSWLLDRLESFCRTAELQTCAQLADRTRHDDAFQQVAAIYTGSDTFDASALVSGLIATDNVPQMAGARYKPKAMPKFRAWQETWDKQRAEDAIDIRRELDPSDPEFLTAEHANALKAKQIGDIPLPPKYADADFRKPSYRPLRGKLDVPKERFFSLPHCEKEGDNTLVMGWAGLNHLQRAQAIASWYLERKEQEGWDAERLKPMLVALDELIPWLKQWHNEIDPEYGERLGDYYEGFLLEELRQLELSRDELSAWEPPAARRGGGRRRRKA